MKYGFGIDLGGTTVKLAFFSEDGVMLDKWEIPTVKDGGGSRILPDIAASVQAYLSGSPISREEVLGIGIGVPGPVDGNGVINHCVNLGWGVVNIRQALSALTGLPVVAGNDANVAALGEGWKGGGQGCENMIFATLGTGVGGGIVIGGRVVHGVHGAGGEIGHFTVDPTEKAVCGCGRHGCAEQYCSATGIVRQAKQALAKDGRASSLREIENLTCKDVFDGAAAGDGVARDVLERVYDILGLFLANLCSIVDPEAVVLGGGVSKAGQPLLDGVRRYFDKYAFYGVKDVRFALASLGNDAGAYGAFKLLLTEREA